MEIGGIPSISVDRLSSLCDDVLIGIMSFLPLRLAIVMGSLSRRWRRGLWTNVTSIIIKPPDFEHFPEFMSHITSPSIDRFIVEYEAKVDASIWRPLLDSWLRQACDRNVRELKLACPRFRGSRYTENLLPNFVLEMQSLTSMELCSIYNLKLPDDGQIKLPNLKILRVTHCDVDFRLLGTLIKACPSLEDLILVSGWIDIKIFNQNLRRLVIDTGPSKSSEVVINAPKLEQLVCHCEKTVICRFEDKPSALREAKIDFNHKGGLRRWDEDKEIFEFYEAISNVSFLTLDYVPDTMSTVFCNATRVTLSMNHCHNIKTVSTLIEACPLLDVLTLKVDGDINDTRGMILGKLNNRTRTSRRVLKRIEIEADLNSCTGPVESFLKLVKHLLDGAVHLDHFYFKAVVDGQNNLTKKGRTRMELDLCKLICKCRMASRGCKVEFEGMFHKYVSTPNQGKSKRLIGKH